MSGFEFRDERVVLPTATLEDGAWSVTQAHGALFASERLQEVLVEAVLSAARGRTATEFRDALDDAGVDAVGGLYRELCVRVAKGDRRALFDLLSITRQLGGRTAVDIQSTRADLASVARLLSLAGDVDATVEIRIGPAWTGGDLAQQRELVEYLSGLAETVDVVLVGGPIERGYLRTHFRDELPTSVTERPNAQGDTPAPEAILDEVGTDGVAMRVLRALEEQTSGVLSYTRLQNALDDLHRSTISRALNEVLVPNGLVDVFGGRGNKRVEILDAGGRYLDFVAESVGLQGTLETDVTETGNRSNNAVSNHAHARGGEEEDRQRYRLPHWHDVSYLSRSETVAAALTPPERGVSLTDHPVEPKDDRGEAGWGYLDEQDTLVVSAEADGPLQHMVCVARALSDWRTWHHVLGEDRLAELDDLVAEGKPLLHGSRCLGYLADEIETAADYAAVLQEARDDLLDLTRKLSTGEYEMSEDAFRSVITREAMGLAGTMRHLLDLAGVDVVWEVRLPEFTRRFDADRATEVATMIATNAAIAASLGHNVAYRQLFEGREDKRRQAIDPTINAEAPYGTLLGGISVVGDFGNRLDEFEAALREALASPAELHDDAPEFAVRVPVRTQHDRPTYAQIVRELCRAKQLDATREAVSLCQAFAATPYDVADAIGRGLSRESRRRDIRLDEVRRALSTLDADRLLEGAAPTVGKAVRALLQATEPLTQAALADRAGVTARSLRTHLPTLVAMGLVRETETGYRLALSFSTDDERYADVLPWFVDDDLAMARDVVFEAVEALGIDEPAVWSVWIDVAPDGVPDMERLIGRLPWLSWALPLLRVLCGQDVAVDERVEQFGRPPKQASIQATATGVA